MTRQTHIKQQYKILIERDEDGYFIASVPALPGCYTQAKTFPELTRRVKDAIKLCLAVAKSDPQYRKKIAHYGYEPSFVGVELISL